MNFDIEIPSSPSFYIRAGLFLLAMALLCLLFLHTSSITWFAIECLSGFAAIMIAGGIFLYFRILHFGPALYKILLGLSKLVIALVLLCCAIAAFLFWEADPFNLSAPADQKLITIFHDHREAFEQLRKMATEDVGRASYITQASILGNISEARKQEYKTLLSEIYPRGFHFLYPGSLNLYPGLHISADADGFVRFTFAGGGLSAIGPGWGKGIDYQPGRIIGTLVQNLDKAHTLPPGHDYLREIEPGWYIFYSKDEG